MHHQPPMMAKRSHRLIKLIMAYLCFGSTENQITNIAHANTVTHHGLLN